MDEEKDSWEGHPGQQGLDGQEMRQKTAGRGQVRDGDSRRYQGCDK